MSVCEKNWEKQKMFLVRTRKKILQEMSVLKQYCVYSDMNDKEKCKGLIQSLY